jgi:hypothetical protein
MSDSFLIALRRWLQLRGKAPKTKRDSKPRTNSNPKSVKSGLKGVKKRKIPFKAMLKRKQGK